MPFVNPRTNPVPSGAVAPLRLTSDPDALTPLHDACRQGRIYDVERWIVDGHPLQLGPDPELFLRRKTALTIAIEQRNHALLHLLLCNGARPDLEPRRHLDAALDARRPDLVELLLTWGTDPQRVDLYRVFDSYSTPLFERLCAAGVDLTRGFTLARHLADHAGNKPLFGFAKRHRDADPAIRRHLQMALAHHAHRGNEKGVLLCLWAGADPHAPADWLPDRDYPDDEEEEDQVEDAGGYYSALSAACSGGHADLVERFGVDADHLNRLFHSAATPAVVDVLARHGLPTDMTPIVEWDLHQAGWRLRGSDPVGALRRLFEHGARWTHASPDLLRELRRRIIGYHDHAFEQVVLTLAMPDAVAPEILHELGRTPAFERRLRACNLLPENRAWRQRLNAYDIATVLLAFRPMSRHARRLADNPVPPPTLRLGKRVPG